jgi:hypothetical protein
MMQFMVAMIASLETIDSRFPCVRRGEMISFPRRICARALFDSIRRIKVRLPGENFGRHYK